MNPIQLSSRQTVSICFMSIWIIKTAGKIKKSGTNEKAPFEASVSFENKPSLCLGNSPLTKVSLI